MDTPDYKIRHQFSKAERLKSKKLINKLFQCGKALNVYPVRVIYYTAPDLALPNHQVLFAAPKKKIKKAVTRNLLKRRMREAHRLNKYLLQVSTGSSAYFLIGYIYMGDPDLGSFNTLQKKVIKALEYIKNQPWLSTTEI